MRILFAGESWATQETHLKGFDTVDLGRLELDWAKPAFDVIRASGIEMEHMPSHIALYDFPETVDALKEYDAVILSDIGSNTLLLDPRMQFKLEKKPNRLLALVDYVKQGGGLIMFGGYMSFSGIENKARYAMTPLAQVLPVEMLNYDDRMEHPEGIVPEIINKNHPVLKDAPEGEWPPFLGYNKIKAKKEAEEIATINGDTFMAAMEYGEGRTFAFASDCVPHWGSKEFTQWEGYKELFPNIIRWVAKEL